MGPENKIDLGNCALYLNGEPIAWGQGELPEIIVPDEVLEPRNGLPCELHGMYAVFQNTEALAVPGAEEIYQADDVRGDKP